MSMSKTYINIPTSVNKEKIFLKASKNMLLGYCLFAFHYLSLNLNKAPHFDFGIFDIYNFIKNQSFSLCVSKERNP